MHQKSIEDKILKPQTTGDYRLQDATGQKPETLWHCLPSHMYVIIICKHETQHTHTHTHVDKVQWNSSQTAAAAKSFARSPKLASKILHSSGPTWRPHKRLTQNYPSIQHLVSMPGVPRSVSKRVHPCETCLFLWLFLPCPPGIPRYHKRSQSVDPCLGSPVIQHVTSSFLSQ